MKAIAAISSNRAIGKNGALPWPSIKEDFKWFKEFTTNNILVMGNTTFTSLPPLKNRNIVTLTSNPMLYSSGYDPALNMGHCYRNSLEIVKLDSEKKGALIVAGGAKTYLTLLPFITEFYITHVNGEFEGDTFMPPIEHMFNKSETVREFENGHKVVKYYN